VRGGCDEPLPEACGGNRIDRQSHLDPLLNSKSSDNTKFLSALVEKLLQLESRRRAECASIP
jgi:hypothetical protein